VTSAPSIVPTVRLTLRTGHVDAHRRAARERRLGERDELDVERLVEPVVLRDDLGDRRALGQLGQVQHRREVEPGGLPVVDGAGGVEHLDVADRLLQARKPSDARISRTSWAMYSKKVTTNSALPEYFSRSSLRCVGDADRAGVEVADAHHDAADTTSGAVAKPYSSAPSSAPMTTSRPVLSWPVDLHDDAVAQAVEQQRLLRLGQAQLPRRAGVLERGERRGARPAVVAGDEHDVGVRLGDTRPRPSRRRPRPRA
jgi:hypothetical protein